MTNSFRQRNKYDTVERSHTNTRYLTVPLEHNMGCSVVFVTLTMLFVSLGNLIQITNSLGHSDPIWSTHSEKRSQAARHILATEVIHYPESRSDSEEGSGQNVESMLHMTRTVVLKELDSQLKDGHTTNTIVYDSSGIAHHFMVSEETSLKAGQKTPEEQLNGDGDIPELSVQTNVFTPKTNHNVSGPAGSCLFGVSPCLILTNFNGTSLKWDDMKRTLAFAWELHVFGSAGLFILLALLAVLGMVRAHTLPHPLCEALTLTNSLLVISLTLRAVLLLLDPYGTRQILSRATLAALHNVSLHLLLWAQIALALVTLRGLTLLFLQLEAQHLRVVGALAVLHSTPLLVADLYSTTVSPALPLLLQTLSLCWGIPLGMGIFTKSLSNLPDFLRSSLPQWIPSHRLERRAKRVTAACAGLGILSCSLHMYSLLWLYGLLGNWRRFGWGWWLCQFWARVLELFWGFSLVVLGSWIFWTSSRGHSRVEHVQGRGDGSKKASLFGTMLSHFKKRPLRKSEKTWEELMPNNWAKYNLSRTGISNARGTYNDRSSTYKPDNMPDPVSTTSYDSQAAVLWQKVGEHECVLSLIEFDMVPPSPINLRRSIDNALHHEQLVSGSLFIAPPPSWTHTVTDTDNTDGDDMIPPAYASYSWMMDTESIPASLDHFQTSESNPVKQDDLSDDYITDL